MRFRHFYVLLCLVTVAILPMWAHQNLDAKYYKSVNVYQKPLKLVTIKMDKFTGQKKINAKCDVYADADVRVSEMARTSALTI